MPFGLIASAAVAIGKRVLGKHLVDGTALSVPGAAVEHAVSGLGVRFFIGAGIALYGTQPTVRTAINNLIAAVTEVFI